MKMQLDEVVRPDSYESFGTLIDERQLARITPASEGIRETKSHRPAIFSELLEDLKTGLHRHRVDYGPFTILAKQSITSKDGRKGVDSITGTESNCLTLGVTQVIVRAVIAHADIPPATGGYEAQNIVQGRWAIDKTEANSIAGFLWQMICLNGMCISARTKESGLSRRKSTAGFDDRQAGWVLNQVRALPAAFDGHRKQVERWGNTDVEPADTYELACRCWEDGVYSDAKIGQVLDGVRRANRDDFDENTTPELLPERGSNALCRLNSVTAVTDGHRNRLNPFTAGRSGADYKVLAIVDDIVNRKSTTKVNATVVVPETV